MFVAMNVESDEQTTGTEQTEAGRRHIVLDFSGIELPCTGIAYDGCVTSLLKIGPTIFDVMR